MPSSATMEGTISPERMARSRGVFAASDQRQASSCGLQLSGPVDFYGEWVEVKMVKIFHSLFFKIIFYLCNGGKFYGRKKVRE